MEKSNRIDGSLYFYLVKPVNTIISEPINWSRTDSQKYNIN